MKKLVISLLSCLFAFGNSAFIQSSSSLTLAQSNVPEYAKWGQLAVQKTMDKYPKAAIIDYLHIGKVKRGGSSTEKFKLWLREETKEFGVVVEIEYDTKTEKIIQIVFNEVTK